MGLHSQATSPKKMMKEILSQGILKVPPTKRDMNGKRKGDLRKVEPEFYDFHPPDAKGTHLSEKEIINYDEQSLAGNPAYMIDILTL